MSSSVLIGQWDVAKDFLGGFEGRFKKALETSVKREALNLSGQIKKGIRNQAPGGKTFAPPSEMTLANRKFQGKRGRTKALIVNGDLLNSVTHKQEGAAAWVGVRRKTMRGENGDEKDMVNIAAVHEYGFRPVVIPYTDKVRRYLFAMMNEAGIEPRAFTPGSKSDVIVFEIPARPFLRPSHAEWQKGLKDRFEKHVQELMGL